MPPAHASSRAEHLCGPSASFCGRLLWRAVSGAFGWELFFFSRTDPLLQDVHCLWSACVSLGACRDFFLPSHCQCQRVPRSGSCGRLVLSTKETSGAPHAEIHQCGRSSPELEILAARSVLSDWLVPHQASCWSVPRTQRYKWTWTRTKETPRGIETTMQRYVETQTTRKKRKEKPKGITEKQRKEQEKQKAATSAMSVTSAPAAILPVCAASSTTSC